MSNVTVPSGGDPDLTKVSDVATPVELEHVIKVSSEFVDKTPVTLEWSQSFKTKSDTYYQAVYTNISQSDAKYYLFISSGKLDEFRKLDSACGADGKLTIKVTPDFQYGQKDKTGKNRFLVYHEEDRKVMKQGRFIKAAWMKYGIMASGFIDNFKGEGDVAKMLEIMAKFMGDSLRGFK